MFLNDRPKAGAIYYRSDDHSVLRFRRKPKKGLLKIEEGKPLTFFVLADDYSSKGIWVHLVGVHFIKGTQIACSEEEKVPAPCFTCERIREMRVGGSEIFPYLGPLKYAMNVLIKGEETPRVFLAPTRVVDEPPG